ncbi:hypothetical protein [Vannielia litorea]|uniref:50S ribosomal protein L35 n=1 Tax=Vannielia litorea TaxID=1217970 RepID=A0A1N6DVQ7_9RHOB|nr:hypothetical protein [Vannielia litorea]SIN74797.1 hypothetical protein SAMN05444002_0054 [Vannielia litorea]
MNIDTDVIFVIGLVVGLLSIPALIGAFSESRPPRAAAILVLIAAGLISIAVIRKPGGYTLSSAPDVFMKVISGIVN